MGRVCRIGLRRRRLRCPEHGVVAEAVPFARPGSGFTRDFEQMVAWLVTKTDKKTICELLRIGWRTVGAIASRVTEEELDPERLSGLVDIGVDEISWKKNHHYLTLVSNHATGKIVWGRAGKDTGTLNAFFDDVGERSLPRLPREHSLQRMLDTAITISTGEPDARKSGTSGVRREALRCIPGAVGMNSEGGSWVA